MLMEVVQMLLHVDVYVNTLIQFFGPWTYVILFLIIFAETGLVITPFLPGDSLLFVIGAMAGSGFLNIFAVYITLLVAAILGDTVNYWVGHHLGPRVFSNDNSRLFNKKYLEKTREFYAKHGGKTIVLARFVPVIRTFAPFVAGIGNMEYKTFAFYNVIGGFLWITGLTYAGYFFGGLPIIKNNFEYAILIIVLVSLIPVVIEYIKHKQESRVSKKQLEHATYKDIQKTFKEER